MNSTPASSTFPMAPADRDRPVRILLVEDTPTDAKVFRIKLETLGFGRFEIRHADAIEPALALMAEGEFDVILLDLNLGETKGVKTVERAFGASRGVPIIALTTDDDGRLEREILHAGAQDFLVKVQSDGHAISRAIHHAIERGDNLRELERMRREQMEHKDQFLSHVSHELRTPLATIHQFITILRDELVGSLNGEQAECVRIAMTNVLQLRRMIEDLLEVSRATVGKLTVECSRVEVAPLIYDSILAIEARARERGIRVTAEIGDGVPPLYADATRVAQILQNLLENAVKYTPPGGSVAVRCFALEEPGSEMAEIVVSDTGTGIAAEHRDRILEPYYQAEKPIDDRRRGLGLGLHICRELVLRHGGRLRVESELGRGTDIHVLLPTYSLRRLLLPIFNAENLARGTFAVIEIEAKITGARERAPENGAALRELLLRLDGCLLVNLDVLLPPAHAGGAREQFHIVACADERGCRILTDRIMAHLSQANSVQSGVISLHTRFHPIRIRPAADGRATAALLEVIERLTLSPQGGTEWQN